MKYDVVVVAGGKGERAKLGYNKAFFTMNNGKTVLENACKLFIEDEDCERVIVVTSKDCFDRVFKNDKLYIVEGGSERKDSVFNGLDQVVNDYVLIHDAARPYLRKESLELLKSEVEMYGSAILAKQAIDTIKVVENGDIKETIDRNKIYMAETPQGFRSELIRKAYEANGSSPCTDDASVVEKLGVNVRVVKSEYDNHKLTNVLDFVDA